MENENRPSKLKFILTGMIVSACLSILFYQRDKTTREKSFDPIIKSTAKKHDIDATLIKAVIKRESSFRKDIRGAKEEYGLMQITTGAADDWSRVNKKEKFKDYDILLDPSMNIEIGSWYLARALKKWDSWKDREILALAEYNAGGSNARKWAPKNKSDSVIDKITFPNTKQYIKDILAYRKLYQENWNSQ